VELTNLLVEHGGFTLNDLYSCNGPSNNQPWPYGPSDGGSSTNYSWDQGGAATDQRAAARVGFALLMLSAGTPLITGGDEYLRSLYCNNNAYNVDSVANWLNYTWNSDQSNAFVRWHNCLPQGSHCTAPGQFLFLYTVDMVDAHRNNFRHKLLQQRQEPQHRPSV